MSESARTPMPVERIMQMLPHRFPFLMIDRVMEAVKDDYALCVKNVTINEHHFIGHFSDKPVMPGVLIIEAMAQTSAVLVVQTLGPQSEGKLVYFMSVDEAKFRKPVVPGDQLHIRATKQRQRGNVWKFACEAFVAEVKVAEAIITAMILD
ncbi:MAG: 3-hydroxyacyl-ACP dehydratase FabZ [Alphaproteobacteria bacterium]|nr:3-hydroxyacyl-ACP dehydratase FabZ [Alphaproteobacteria bacterium]